MDEWNDCFVKSKQNWIYHYSMMIVFILQIVEFWHDNIWWWWWWYFSCNEEKKKNSKKSNTVIFFVFVVKKIFIFLWLSRKTSSSSTYRHTHTHHSFKMSIHFTIQGFVWRVLLLLLLLVHWMITIYIPDAQSWQ